VAYRSSAITSSATGGNLTATPAGVQAHDYLSLQFTRDAVQAAPSWPAGWTQRVDNSRSTPDGIGSFVADKDDATGSDDFTVVDGNTNQSALITSALSGRYNAAPRSATPVATQNLASNASPISASYTGITAQDLDDILVYKETDQLAADGRWNFDVITGYTEREDGVATDWVSGLALDTRDAVGAGATGALASTITRTSGTGNAGYGAVVMAIKATPPPDVSFRTEARRPHPFSPGNAR